MKERYVDILEKIVSIYSLEHIDEYTEEIRTNGLREQGFTRLTADIGILMSHGRRLDLKDRFEDMMTLSCQGILLATDKPSRASNDFSVKEIVLSLLLLEKAELFPKEKFEFWRSLLKKIDPYQCYHVIAKNPPEPINNWAAFNAASEQMRKYAGIASEDAYIDNQVASQIMCFDENGMYRDPGEPMVYDITTRLQLSILMFFGYNGPHKDELDRLLALGGPTTLMLQSVTGELPFGGRSQQCLFTEVLIASTCEYEASRHAKLGNLELAGQFKRAAVLATDALERYLDDPDITHIKNCYPRDSKYGCEGYAYFNKYMVTCGSFLYLGYLFADDTIKPVPCPAEVGGHIYKPADHFHRIVANCGGYFIQYDTNAQVTQDASGLGRVHKVGAPSTICLSMPFSATPKYTIDIENPFPLSICCGCSADGEFSYTSYTETVFDLVSESASPDKALLVWEYTLSNGKNMSETCAVSSDGVYLVANGEGNVRYLIPTFEFDGKHHPVISHNENTVTVEYNGYRCTYSSSGKISETNQVFANRNGHYKLFIAEAENEIDLKISISKI